MYISFHFDVACWVLLVSILILYSTSSLTNTISILLPSSTIPTEIGLLTSLEFLTLEEQTKIDSTIPTEFGHLSSLQVLHFDRNTKLHGTIPTELGRLFSTFKELYLGKTGITGTLPTELALLTRLTTIDTYDTLLTGSVPADICQLPLFESILVACATNGAHQFDDCKCCYCF